MKFLKNLDHLKIIQFALGLSIFLIGYLVTMFYFQMHDLKEYKQRIVLYNNASINILHLELEMERDNHFTQDQLVKQNISSQKTNLDDLYNASFLKKNNILKKNDPEILNRKTEIKELVKRYEKSKIQIFKENSASNARAFDLAVKSLKQSINRHKNYLESKIDLYNYNYDKLIANAKTSSYLIAFISIVLFILSYLKMNKNLNKLKRIKDDLLFSNEILNNAEMIAGFGSWKVNTVENNYMFSDNFYRLISVQPKEFKASLSNIMDFIHPDDREEVLKQHHKSFIKQENSTITYRYLLQDGTIKHMVSVGKFIYNAKGQLIKIGVNQDVTSLMKKTKELENKNNKLVLINSELESFNNIVSHDLQEPLRKIQMFISRIESQEFLESSAESTLEYFNRIKSTAKRMQNLMSDLVDYTRTVKGDRVFEEVHLNAIFEDIKEELAFTIEEKNAKIFIDKMPVVLGTRFQIQQLFINLISNALKYVRLEVNPIISIKLENFTQDLVNDYKVSNKEYYKITVTDNGIGFEQQYADKVFMLFKRLETDHNYKGTGLGLAICKKIVDNHGGFIIADGKPNLGAVFTIYMPKNMDV